MNFPPFLLDQWIAQKNFADPPIEYDLASSTGPLWTVRELLALGSGEEFDRLLDTRISYTSAAGTHELRSAIASLEGVDSSEVQIVTGAAEALLILFAIAAGQQSNIVLPRPGFPAYEALAESLGIETRHYILRAENGFRIDPDEIRKATDRATRLLLVNSPHNPTGAVLADEEMKQLHDFCLERRVQFVSDEVYHPIYHGTRAQSAARLPHATVISDFSKALCLSGLRVGWLVERDPARRQQYLNARNYFTICNNALGERLATFALLHKDEVYARAQRVATVNLTLLDQVLAANAGTVRWLRPAGGMTAFPWFVDSSDSREFCRALAKRGVLIVPGDCFGTPSHFRIGFAASGDRFPLAMDRLAEALRSESDGGRRAIPAVTAAKRQEA